MTERNYVRLRKVRRHGTTPVDVRWKRSLEALQSYVRHHGELPTVTKDRSLGLWVLEVRKEYQRASDHSYFDPAKIAALEAIPGWYWKTSDRHNFDFRVKQVGDWMREHPHLEQVPSTISDQLGFRIDHWLSKMRALKLASELSAQEIALLETIPHWRWVAKKIYRRSFVERELSWRLKTALEEEVRSGSARGATKLWNCDIVILDRKIVVEYDGEWAHCEREQSDREKTADLIAAGWTVLRLRELPLSRINDWDLLASTKEELGDLADRVVAFLVSNGCSKKSNTQSHLPKYQGLREQADDPWYEGYALLKRYEAEFGSCARDIAKEYEGFRLWQWAYVQRRAKKRGLLSDRKIALLSNLSTWQWETMPQLNLGWDEAFRRAVEFQTAEGHYPPARYKSPDGFSLGRWTANQRDDYRRGRLGADRVSALSCLSGWAWGATRKQKESG